MVVEGQVKPAEIAAEEEKAASKAETVEPLLREVGAEAVSPVIQVKPGFQTVTIIIKHAIILLLHVPI